MSDILNFNVVRALDLDGYPVPGAQALFFDSGTDTPREAFADPDGDVPHPTPLVADGEGIFPPVYVLGGASVRAEVRDEDGAMLTGYPLDPVPRAPIGASGASQVSFNPTGDIPATTVQAAIERVQANLVEPLLEGGIGVTGNAPYLASLDAANTPSGFYRYDGDTTGTFPSGVTKANGGIVQLLRKTSTAAEMTIQPTGDAAFYWRELATTWGTWSKSLAEVSHSEATWKAGSSTVIRGISPDLLDAVISAVAIGVGQSWQNVQASRSVGVTYQNSTGRPISVSVTLEYSSGNHTFQVSTNGTDWVTLGRVAYSNSWPMMGGIIPAGHRYRVTGGLILFWVELR